MKIKLVIPWPESIIIPVFSPLEINASKDDGQS